MLCYNLYYGYHIKKNLPFDFVTFSVTDIYLNIIYTHYKLKKNKKIKLMDYLSKFASINASISKFLSL
jgi:hypothetical protein